MYLRVSRGRYDSSRQAEIDRLVREEIIPAMQALPGFAGYSCGIDPGTEAIIVVSTWDSREHATFSTEVIAQAVTDVRSAGHIRIESTEVYDVLDHI